MSPRAKKPAPVPKHRAILDGLRAVALDDEELVSYSPRIEPIANVPRRLYWAHFKIKEPNA